MQTERWKLIDEIFQAAIDCSLDHRSAYLDSACGSDPELRAEVESLLASHDQAAFTSSPAFDDGMKLLERRASQLPEGSRIGPYRILREIGHGGMGSVYLAARADEAYQKLVAIKVIRRGLDTDDIIQRFRNERQILARLDHPNIARLLDAGSTADGLPYFVMEYIEGEPIEQYCDARKLSITDRLRLFQQVCEAVRYAHQNLVIHRDIKPGNVLVTQEGVPRLLDFGIAKLLTSGPEAPEATATVARRLTPEYASPEQVRGEPITTASDVYSLGVLLYRLLTGHSPYRIATSSGLELERAICEEEPQGPSAVVSRTDSKPGAKSVNSASANSSVAPNASRESSVDKLRRRLEGDLDNIVLMALHKEPHRRYASADQLSEDITRHLSNLPIMARPDTTGYRTAKFIRRHKAGVSAAALVFVSLTGGIAITLWQTHVARSERARAERQFNNVRALTTSFLFEFHTAIRDLPGSTPARKLLVQRALEYLGKLAGESRGDRRLQLDLAEAYLKVGDVQGNAYEANLGDPEGAAKSYRKALEISESLALSNNKDIESRRYQARSYQSLGEVLPVLGDLNEAATDLQKAIGIFESLLVLNERDKGLSQALAACYQDLGDVQGHSGLENLGDKVGALQNYQRSIGLYQSLATEDPTNSVARRGTALLQIRIGDLKEDRDDLQGGLQAYLGALKTMEAIAASEPTNSEDQRRLAHAYRKVGGVQEDLRNFQDALHYYDKAAAINESLMNADPKNYQASMGYVISLRWSGDLLNRLGKSSAALDKYRKVLDILDRLATADPQNVLVRGRQSDMMIFIAEPLIQNGQPNEARRMTLRGLAITRELARRAEATPDELGEYAMNFLTCVPVDLREPATALRYAGNGSAKSGGSDSDGLDILAQAYFATGDVKRAVESEEKAIQLLAPPQPNQPDPPRRRKMKAELAKFKLRLGRG